MWLLVYCHSVKAPSPKYYRHIYLGFFCPPSLPTPVLMYFIVLPGILNFPFIYIKSYVLWSVSGLFILFHWSICWILICYHFIFLCSWIMHVFILLGELLTHGIKFSSKVSWLGLYWVYLWGLVSFAFLLSILLCLGVYQEWEVQEAYILMGKERETEHVNRSFICVSSSPALAFRCEKLRCS